MNGFKNKYVIQLLILIISCVFISCSKDATIDVEENYGDDFVYVDVSKCDDIREEDKIFDGNLYFRTQEEIVAFGKQNYTVVKGTIRIGQNRGKSITDLSPLLSLVKICGSLILGVDESDPDFSRVYVTDLPNLEGLNNIVFIQGSLVLLGNESLENIDALRNLIYVGGNLLIQSNNELKSLDGFSNLQEVGISIKIGSVSSSNLPNIEPTNRKLSDFSGLGKIKDIGGSIKINGNLGSSSINFVNNGFNAFGNLQTLGSSSISIANVSNLGIAFKKLSELQHLSISQCLVTYLDNFNYSSTIKTIDLTFNDNLQFDRVIGKTMKLIRIAGNPLIKDIAFPELQECEIISIDRSFLENLNFPRLSNIINTLYVLRNTHLKTIDLPELNTTNNLTLYSNEALLTISSPKLVDANSIRFHDNTSIQDLAFPQLSTAIFGFRITNNTSIKNILLPSLSNSLESFQVEGNSMLTEILCPNLIGVDKLIHIENNNILEKINFENLESASILEISRQNSLKEVNFKSLKSVDQMTLIGLNYLAPFNNLQIISESAKISQITQQSYSGFKNLLEVKQRFELSNMLIPNFDDSFDKLERVEGGVFLLNSNYIKFQSLVEVSGQLSISGNDNIIDLSGFVNLETIGEGLFINNTHLESLELNKLNIVGVHHATQDFNKEFSILINRNSKLKSYCSIKDANFEETLFEVTENLFNPTLTELRNGNCWQQ